MSHDRHPKAPGASLPERSPGGLRLAGPERVQGAQQVKESVMQLRVPVALFFLLALAACGGGGSSSPDAGDTVNCASDPRVTTYKPNLTVASKTGGTKVTLVSSDPSPPAKAVNTWNLHVTDGAGNPLPSVALNVDTLMPDHGHKSTTVPQVANKGGGDYQVTLLDLFMPGVWHVWFFTGTATTDTADFWFCVQG
jgi:YtkA-like